MLLRSLPLDSDSRTSKMMAAYGEAGYSVHALAWNRGRTGTPQSSVTYYDGQGAIGARWRNLFNLLRWWMFLAVELVRRRRDYAIVHVIDFDTAIIGVPVGRLLRKRIVYDGYDHFGASRQGALRTIFGLWEDRLLRAADLVILPSVWRIEQYGIADLEPVIISNLPDDMAAPERSDPAYADAQLSIAYVGTLVGTHRGLEYLADICAAFPEVRIIVGGLGELAPWFAEQSARHPNLQFVGQLTYGEALRVMGAADCLYGPYLLTTDTHAYASPNKMYEHVLLGKPLITNEGTPVGDFVRENGTGYVFDGSREALARLIAGTTREDCRRRGQHARALWDARLRHVRQEELDIFFARLAAELRPEKSRS